MISAQEAVKMTEGMAFERAKLIPGSSYKDNSTVVIVPTRGMIHHRIANAFQNLMAPMNQKRFWIYASGHEVGHAYNECLEFVLSHPELTKFKYVLTLEDDNLPPVDAHIRLLESIEAGPFDAVSGIYFTKGLYNMPMAYGDPEKFARTGVLDFTPRNPVEALERGYVMPVNGIAMGCALWRMDLFKQIQKPWFVTLQDMVPDKGAVAFTQDLYFCEKAVRAGKRFATDFRVKVGHMDVSSPNGEVY